MESTIYTVAGREFELQHYGVKGMKWGRRKKPEPYRQDLGGGVSAVWPSKKAYKKAERQRIKTEKKNFKADVRDAKKKGMAGDYEFDPKTGQLTITQWYDRNGKKVSRDYAAKVQGRVALDRTIAVYAGTAAFALGASAVSAMLGRS
jgi:hypothetical protein